MNKNGEANAACCKSKHLISKHVPYIAWLRFHVFLQYFVADQGSTENTYVLVVDGAAPESCYTVRTRKRLAAPSHLIYELI